MSKVIDNIEDIASIDSKSTIASPTFTGTPTVNGVAFGGFSGFKNYIINGNFDVWQYGISQTGSGYGSDDRWANYNIGSTKTHSQVACGDTERALFNASKFSRTVVASVAGVSNFVNKVQFIEDVTKLAGKTITLSFWAKADSAKNIQIIIAQGYGTGGSPSAKTFNIQPLTELTSNWQKKTITVEIPSIVGKTLGTDGVHTSYTQIYFVFEAGSSWIPGLTIGQQSGTFDIAQVQLEEGSVATPFEQRPYGLELSLCQKYLPSFTSFAGTGTVRTSTMAAITIPFKVETRVAPTGITVSGLAIIENSGNWTQMTGSFSSASRTSANTLWTNMAASMTLGQGCMLNTGANTILFTGCEL